tara:strand:- start:302 stop:505 length:204 start_codon:yes stop_codon:yes gene_type:complete
MNERIKQLAEQATIVTENFYDSEHGYYTHREFDKEKFADLILFECINLAVLRGDKETADAIKNTFWR